jgi:hypothetical protein
MDIEPLVDSWLTKLVDDHEGRWISDLRRTLSACADDGDLLVREAAECWLAALRVMGNLVCEAPGERYETLVVQAAVLIVRGIQALAAAPQHTQAARALAALAENAASKELSRAV